MGNEEYVLPAGISISAEAADKLLSAGNGDAALLYIYILKNGGKLNTALADKTIVLKNGADAAAACLRELGLIRGGAPAQEKTEKCEAPKSLVKPGDRLPEYSSEDAKTAVNSDPQFAALVAEVQGVMGSILSSSGLMELLGFYDYLGLPPDVILLLVAHCVEEHEKKYGEGKRPTMRMVRAEAYKWADKGVFSLDAAAEYIRNAEKAKKRKSEIRRILGLQDRAPSATEERCITDWAEQGFSDELISAAYDKTVLNTGKLVWKYMNSILQSWAQKGLKTIEDVRTGDRKPEEERSVGTAATGGQEDLERMREYLKKMKQSGG